VAGTQRTNQNLFERKPIMSEITQSQSQQKQDVEQPPRSLFVKPSYESNRVDDEWEISVLMPGVKREHLSVSLEKQELTLVGRRSDDVPEGWRPLYEERVRADYRLRLQLNFDADPDRITAQLEGGVLKLRLPENESAKPRQIEVQ